MTLYDQFILQLYYAGFIIDKPPAPPRVQLVRATTSTLEVCWGNLPTGIVSLLFYANLAWTIAMEHSQYKVQNFQEAALLLIPLLAAEFLQHKILNLLCN